MMRRRGRRKNRFDGEEDQPNGDEGADAPEPKSEAPQPPTDKAPEPAAPASEEQKDSPEIMKKEGLLTQLFEWEGEGYDTTGLEEAVQKNDPHIDAKIKEFEEGVRKLKEVVKKMEEIEVDERLINDIQIIRDMMNNPLKVAEIEEALQKLEVRAGMQKYMDDIESMNTTGLEKDVEAIKALMGDRKNIPEIEKSVKELKRKVKEKFFESEIAMAFQPAPKKKVKKIKIVKTKMGITAEPFKIHDIFLFHHNGELISHHTRRTDLASSKAQLAGMLKVIQNNVKSPKRSEIRRIEFENYRILFQDGASIIVSATITGAERKEMFLLMKKVLDLVEKKYPNEITNWTGDASQFKGIDKYMAALIQVFIKMELKVQQPKQAAPAPPA